MFVVVLGTCLLRCEWKRCTHHACAFARRGENCLLSLCLLLRLNNRVSSEGQVSNAQTAILTKRITLILVCGTGRCTLLLLQWDLLIFAVTVESSHSRPEKCLYTGLKSIQEHETINNIITDLLKDIIPSIQINHSRIISGRFFYNCGFKVDLNKLDQEYKARRISKKI